MIPIVYAGLPIGYRKPELRDVRPSYPLAMKIEDSSMNEGLKGVVNRAVSRCERMVTPSNLEDRTVWIAYEREVSAPAS